MNNLSSAQLAPRITALVAQHWPQLKQPEGSGLVWQYCLSDPLPVCWPLREARLAFYVYAHALDLHQPTAGEMIAHPWAKIITSGDAIEELVLLQSELIPATRKGVRPLSASELQILDCNPIDLLCAPTSTPTAVDNNRAIKSFYQLQLTLGNIPQTAIAHHSDFFNWLAGSTTNNT
jgi:hypothetical protein